MKAFDNVLREILFENLYRFGVRGKMFRVIKDIYSNNKARVLLGQYLSHNLTFFAG